MSVKPSWNRLDLTGGKDNGFVKVLHGGNVFNNLLTINRLMETVKFLDDTMATHNLVVG
jgi:hypothetical protein